MQKLFFALIILIPVSINAQQYVITGNIKDNSTGKELSYANITLKNLSIGTAANLEGRYQLKLKEGNYTLVASYIGYKSDTVEVKLKNDFNLDFFLEPTSVQLSEVTVLPGKNPAIEIIKRAVEAKHKRRQKLNSYEFRAYTKGLIKTTKDISANNQNVDLSIGEQDTAALKITGILENESKGYFKKPDNYKDEIIARKQTANTPPTINILTGGRLLQNFYTDDIQFFGRYLTGPIADNALDYYYYYIEDTLAQDNQTVFQIYFAPNDETDPGFYGNIYITDSTYNLIKLDVNLNNAANPGGIFSKINIFQQFVPYDNNIYMPIDYRLFVEGNVLGLVKFGFEINSIFFNYEINKEIPDDFFDLAVLTVKPDADKKDSTFWNSTQTIPNTAEELEAYNRIDSLESVPQTFWDKFSILSNKINFTNNFAVSGPLYLYHFNRVEGHSIDFKLYFEDLFEKRLNMNFNFDYGFGDKKFKSNFSGSYLLGKYRSHSLSFNVFNKTNVLFGESDQYNQLTAALMSFISKYEFRNYYYTKGFDIEASAQVFPVLKLSAGFLNRTDNSGYNTSDFSLFNKDKKYSVNQTIYETRINALTAGFTLDFRKYIEDGYFRRRTAFGSGYALLSGEATFSNSSFLKSKLDFELYSLNFYAAFNSIRNSGLTVAATGVYSNGPVPFQMLYALPGNIESAGKNFSFRTIRLGEVFGDRVIAVGIEQNLSDEFFRLFNIPFISNLQLTTGLHLSAAYLDISDKSAAILPRSYTTFKTPFYEAGFSIGQVLIPFKLEFTWKLNHRGINNFVIGINSAVL